MSVNKVILVGFVGREPETRAFADGSGVTNFSLATSEKYKDKTGEWKEITEWHRIGCFGKLSEIAAKLVSKGSQVYIEGKISTRKWKDANGVEKSSTEVKCDVLQLLGSKEVSKEVKSPPIDIGEISNKASKSLGDIEEDLPF
jgi:single-strand DNA-binding protein